MKKYLYLTIVIASLISCKPKKEELENPIIVDPTPQCDNYNNEDERCATFPAVQAQVALICQKVNQCLEAATDGSQEGCTTLLQMQNGLDLLVTTTAKNYTELNSLYENKKLLTDGLNWHSCIESIESLSCSSTTFTQSYNVNDPLNFSNIHKILESDASCIAVYQMKPATSGTLTFE